MRTGQTFRRYLELRNARHMGWLDPATGMASAAVTEPAACPLCRRDDARLWFTKRGFRWVRCRHCGTVYVNPRLSQEARLMAYCGPDAEFYYTHCATSDRGKIGWQEELTQIHRYRQPGRLLDVACGGGGFLHCARQAGWEVWGVEINPIAAGLAQERYAIRVEVGPFESVTLPDSYFDVVTIFQTLDQLCDPSEALRRMHRLLKPGGLLVMTVPNIRSFMVWMLGAHHRHFTPEKGVSFTPGTLRRFLRVAGFGRILHLRTFGEECTLSNLWELARAGRVADLFERRASQNGTPPERGRTSWLHPAGRSLNRPLIALTRLTGLGSYMALYARSDSPCSGG